MSSEEYVSLREGDTIILDGESREVMQSQVRQGELWVSESNGGYGIETVSKTRAMQDGFMYPYPAAVRNLRRELVYYEWSDITDYFRQCHGHSIDSNFTAYDEKEYDNFWYWLTDKDDQIRNSTYVQLDLVEMLEEAKGCGGDLTSRLAWLIANFGVCPIVYFFW
jgi:hypothetical protein